MVVIVITKINNYLCDTPTPPLSARDNAAIIEDFKPSDLDQSTV